MGGARASRLIFSALLATALVSAACPASAAEPEPEVEVEDELGRPGLAMGAGALVSFVSLAGGATVVARGRVRSVRNAGLLIGQTGLCLSPIVAHAIVGELSRGALFALIPLAAEIGTATLMAFYPNFITSAPPAIQYPTFLFVTSSIFFSAFGVLDAARASERKAARTAGRSPLGGLSFSALVNRELSGIVVGGSL